MKSTKLKGDSTTINEIVARLKLVPKTRLQIVHDVVSALGETRSRKNGRVAAKGRGQKSLLKTPFCGMWEGRLDLGNGQTYAAKLRRNLERRGDRS